MKTFLEKVQNNIRIHEPQFYNSSGDPLAYKIGVKHLSSAIFLGFAQEVHGTLYVKKNFLLVDFDRQTLTQIFKGDKLTITPLEDA